MNNYHMIWKHDNKNLRKWQYLNHLPRSTVCYSLLNHDLLVGERGWCQNIQFWIETRENSLKPTKWSSPHSWRWSSVWSEWPNLCTGHSSPNWIPLKFGLHQLLTWRINRDGYIDYDDYFHYYQHYCVIALFMFHVYVIALFMFHVCVIAWIN